MNDVDFTRWQRIQVMTQRSAQPCAGEIVGAVAAADGDESACDVLDAQLFQERLPDVEGLRGGRKLAADIRGVIVAACRERNEWKRIADIGGRTIAALEGELRDAKSDLAAWTSGRRSLLRDYCETGPGIAAKPLTTRDEPAAFLDEDLLCEDA